MSLPLDELVENPALVNQRAQTLDWDDLLFEYERALDDDAALLAGLGEAQLHFKPQTKVFSISEVVTHALHSDELFWSWVRLLMEGRRAEIDPAALISGAGARPDRLGAEIIALIEAVRSMARDTLELRPDPIDLHSTAPHPYFGELNAKGWIMFMALHHGMHLSQCESVIDTPGFPRGASHQSLTVEEYLQPRERKPWLNTESASQRKSETTKKRVSESKRKPVTKKKPAGAKKPSGKKTTSKR